MKIARLLLSTAYPFISMVAFAQSPKAIEANLLKSFKRIDYWSHHPNENPLIIGDSLEAANNAFGENLKAYSIKYPGTINQTFTSLTKENLDIVTSDDLKFRIFSWDTWTGGTMHFFFNVLQYRVGEKTFAEVIRGAEDNYVPFYKRLYTFKAAGKTYYLATYGTIFSTKDVGEGIKVFAIENGKLNKAVNLIRTKSGLHNKLYYDYDFSTIADWEITGKVSDWKDVPAISFDITTNSIYLPVITDKGRATGKFITYKFTGKYFEKVSTLAK
ncbi:hypothetical protein [Mucilaginibacter sp.]|uniref:hypothetical protein n=1 Tax=Mucilaginibacter sp. TaxID=1882438 RepID=UPI0035BBAF60